MFRSIALVSSFLFLLSCAKDEVQVNDGTLKCTLYQFEKPSRYSVILIAGQSNTHSGMGLDTLLDTISPGILQLGREGDHDYKLIPASAPLEHHTAVSGKIGFGLTFANLYKERMLDKEDSIVLIPCGFGGSGFEDKRWNYGNDLYLDAVARVNFVLDKYPGSTLQAILWHQGEADVLYPDYEEALFNFIGSIRKDVGYPNSPFILGGMVPFYVLANEKRKIQQEIIMKMPEKLCQLGYADPFVPDTIFKPDNLVDPIHFDAAGQREMGKRYFEEYIRIIEN